MQCFKTGYARSFQPPPKDIPIYSITFPAGNFYVAYMEYQPGLHLLATLYTQRIDLLHESSHWRAFIQHQIKQHALTEVGNCVHDFPLGGYTAVHCLTESHISIHTWPEYGLCTCDVFLSNFRKNNDAITTAIMEELQRFFETTRHESHCIRR